MPGVPGSTIHQRRELPSLFPLVLIVLACSSLLFYIHQHNHLGAVGFLLSHPIDHLIYCLHFHWCVIVL